MSHPNIMSIYELLSDGKFYFIVSEYLKGGELYEYLCNQGSISELLVQNIVQQLFLAVNYMH